LIRAAVSDMHKMRAGALSPRSKVALNAWTLAPEHMLMRTFGSQAGSDRVIVLDRLRISLFGERAGPIINEPLLEMSTGRMN